MKKFLAMILALVMALSLVACGDKKDDPKTDDNQGDNPEVTEITNADEIADEMTSEDGKYEIAFVTDVGQLKDKHLRRREAVRCQQRPELQVLSARQRRPGYR